jgi:hypothetical protein
MAIYLSREEVVFLPELVEMALRNETVSAAFKKRYGTFGLDIVEGFERDTRHFIQCEVPGCREMFSGKNKYAERGTHEKTHNKERS